MDEYTQAIIQFVTPEGEKTGGQMEVPALTDSVKLNNLVNSILENDDHLPYSFSIDGVPVSRSLQEAILETNETIERTINIVYIPESVFRVRAITRCGATLSGHTEAVLVVAFNPQSTLLASGSGDTTIRIWDVLTNTSTAKLQGHRNWVLSLSWSPDGRYLASGGMDNEIRIWKVDGEVSSFRVLRGHRKWITALAWEPIHRFSPAKLLASSSKDFTTRVWNVATGQCIRTLSGHTLSVTCLRWTGDGLIITGSQDRGIKVYEGSTGKLCRTLKGHAHWVNCLSLNTDHLLRSGSFEEGRKATEDAEVEKEYALKRYTEFTKGEPEILASGSDDFTIRLWTPSTSNKPLVVITGHSKPINYVLFSPNGRYIASASFDTFVKLWDGLTGKFICNFRGHVGAVYMACWSSDSRMMVTASKDSTLKLWDLRKKTQKLDLPGHSDEVYAVDWSLDGSYAASGSKDRSIKIWRS